MSQNSLSQIIQMLTSHEPAPDMTVSMLIDRLQPDFPEYNVGDLLDQFGLITKAGAIDSLLLYKGFVRIYERFPDSNALILEVMVTEQGLTLIRSMIQGYLEDEG